jgi:hypothetical protein
MKTLIGKAGIHKDNGGIYSEVYSEVCSEFDGETYVYSMSFDIHHYDQSSGSEIVFGSSIEPPIEFIDELINALKKTKLHMLKNKWNGNVPDLENPPQGVSGV